VSKECEQSAVKDAVKNWMWIC